MTLKVERIDTWSAEIDDKPGRLAEKLAALSAAAIDLEFVIARRTTKQRKGLVFVTPIKGAPKCRAAKLAGFARTTSLHAVRVEGPNKIGMGAAMTQSLAAAGINLRGFSAAAIGGTFVAHFAFDTTHDASRASRLLRKM